MAPTLTVALWSAELLLVAALAATPRGARFALVVAIVALALPAFADLPPFALALAATAVLWCAVRAADFVFEAPPPGFGRRLLHLVAVLDTRALTPAAPRLDLRALTRLAVAVGAGVGAVWLLRVAGALPSWPGLPLRAVGGAVLTLAGLECIAATLGVLVAGAGRSAPTLHDDPHLSRSVAEFWGRRWNRMVAAVLRARAYRPLARHGPWTALVAAFALSAAFHAYLIGFAGGPEAAALWAAFFLLQPPLIALERRLRVRRWPRGAQHAWTTGTLGLLSPLMVMPALRVLGL